MGSGRACRAVQGAELEPKSPGMVCWRKQQHHSSEINQKELEMDSERLVEAIGMHCTRKFQENPAGGSFLLVPLVPAARTPARAAGYEGRG